jgi:Patatin-like phospholipase
MNLLDRLQSDGPKRILALDGGGIRGAITIGYLQEIQTLLRQRYDNPNLLLCDYFDLIGGTSTGSIIAGGLAIGMDVSDIKALYLKLGDKIFGTKRGLFQRLSAKFTIKALEKELQAIFNEMTLGSPQVKTGLCVVTKRADTGSTWPLINHPGGKYFEYNKEILLRKAIRASTAAPTYFMPEAFDVGGGQIGAFVDGGVSMHNNPSLQLFLLATLKGFPFHWKTGDEKLLLTSIGTGFWDTRKTVEEVTDNKLWDWASDVISMLMDDSKTMNQLLLQYLSNSPTAIKIDGEIGDLGNDVLNGKPSLHYLRYDAMLEDENIKNLGFSGIEATDLHEMSKSENCEVLMDIGMRSAKIEVLESHFPAAFDLKPEKLVS